eukprot:10438342-Ditylum_brightwellii.AAC.1
MAHSTLMQHTWHHWAHVTFHEKANQRATWALNGTKVWYIRPALEHYRCYKCFDTLGRTPKSIIHGIEVEAIPVKLFHTLFCPYMFWMQDSKMQAVQALPNGNLALASEYT